MSESQSRNDPEETRRGLVVFLGGLMVFVLSMLLVFNPGWVLGWLAPSSGVVLRDGPTETNAFPLLFRDGEGNTLDLHDFRGRPLVVNLWATWCAPCVREMPELDALQAEFADKGLAVLAISQDTSRPDDPAQARVKTFYETHRLAHLGLYLDELHRLTAPLGAVGLPLTLVFDRQGNEIARATGYVDWEDSIMREKVLEVVRAE